MAIEEDFFLKHVPEQMQVAMARCVLAGCAEARNEAKARPKAWRREATYTFRRLNVEEKLHGMVLPAGFTAKTVDTNSTTYTCIESEHVVITALTRNKKVWSVPSMKYRETFAMQAQCLLFPEEHRDAGTKRLFALLIYGGPLLAERAQECRIVFPLPDGKFAPGDIDLLARHEAILFPKPSQSEKPKPRLRIVKKDKEG